MPPEKQCVVCARTLLITKRADRRYCGSSCRVRAFRVREKRQIPKAANMWDTRRAPRADAESLVGSTRMQLAMFRDLRQARNHAAELTAKLTQTKKAEEQQRREHDQERQALQESLAAARQQNALLETALSETKTLAAAQTAADAQATERLAAEQHRAAARLNELERAACLTAAVHHKTVEQLQATLHGAQQRLAAVDAARLTAETRSQALDAVNGELDAEKKRNAAILDKLVALWTSTNAERAEHERELTEEQQRTTAERQKASALGDRLREATTTLRQQRDQLDKTALSLSMWRAAHDPQVYTAKIEKLNADLLAAQKELVSRTEERDLARTTTDAFIKLLRAESQQLAAVEQELSGQKALVAQQQRFMAELHETMERRYAQIIRIKANKDWRL